jgi:hypothetical protein
MGTSALGGHPPAHPKGIYPQSVFNVNTWYTKMKESTRTRGRPPKRTQDRPFQMRVSESFLRMVDDWRRGQLDVPSRAEAIRRMVELAINAEKKQDTDR